MIDPTLTLSISRLLLPGSPPPLEFSGRRDGTALGLVTFQRPDVQSRNGYAPQNRFRAGSELTSTALNKANLNFSWVLDEADSETDVQAAFNAVQAAITQIRFTITTQVSGAPPEVWYADPGLMSPPVRDYMNLANLDPVYPASVPVHPTPGVS